MLRDTTDVRRERKRKRKSTADIIQKGGIGRAKHCQSFQPLFSEKY